MKKGFINISILGAIAIIGGVLLATNIMYGDGAPEADQRLGGGAAVWIPSQNYLKPFSSTYGLLVPGLATTTTGCLSVGSNGWISASGSACGAGGGGGGTGTVSTSTALVDTYVTYATGPSTIGGESAFTYDDATDTLTVGGGTTAFSISGSANSYINSGYNFGIGTTSPYAKLSVAGETVASHFTATTTATSTLPRLSGTGASFDWLCLTGDTCVTAFSVGASLHVDGGGFVYPQTGDYHSAPYYVGTSTTATSTFPLASVTTAFNLLGDYITNVATWLDTKIEALASVTIGGGNIWDFSSAVIRITANSDPTVDDTGEIAINTTTASSSIVYNGYMLSPYDAKSYTHASSTLSIDGGYGTTGTTTNIIMHPPYAVKFVRGYCKTAPSGTVIYQIGNGSATSTTVCTSSGTEISASISFTRRANVYELIGSQTGDPNYIYVTPEFIIDQTIE